MKPIDLFVFDIAGTTVRDDGLVYHAFASTAESIGIKVDEEWCRARMGLDKVTVFEEMLEEAGRSASEAPELGERFEHAIELWIRDRGVEVLSGAKDAVAKLRRADVRIAFSTGFNRATAVHVLEAAGFDADVIVGSDEVAHGQPELIQEAMRRVGVDDPKRVGIAGDTPSDMQAGHAAGCGFIIGVGHGTHTLEELKMQPHTHLMDDLTGLSDVLGLRA